MRRATILAMLAAAFLATEVARAEKGDAKAKQEVKVAGNAATITVSVGEDGKASVQAAEDKGEKKAGSGDRIKVVRVRPKPAKGEVKGKPKPGAAILKVKPLGGGWLGIRISPVPAAVAAQLGLKDEGVMIRNLVKGSPADRAGLDRYDVIVAVGKGGSVRGVQEFIVQVKAHEPGRKVPLTVIHKGAKKLVEAALDKPPAGGKVDYVYEEDLDDEWQDMLKLHKDMLRKGPKGWVIQVPKGQVVLPPDVLKALPKHPWANVKVHVGAAGGGKKSFKVTRAIDNRTLEIESGDDGAIVVRRSAGKGKSTTTTYKNAEALRVGDPDAYGLYQSVHVVKGLGGSAPRSLESRPLIESGRRAARDLEKEVQEQLKQWAERARKEARGAGWRLARALGPEGVQRDFAVAEDGRITVDVREGGSSAKVTFKDEAQMKAKAPKLHEAYQKLLKADK